MPYHTNLADILRRAGLRVVEVGGWQSRGHGAMGSVQGVMWHHTATPASAKGNFPSQNVVTYGRSDLPGPLCNLGLGRDGTWYVVAAGLAYHAGNGTWAGMTNNGNSQYLGVEAEHPGTAGNPWPAAQIDSYRRGTAALLRAFGLGADRMTFHREYARPIGRKIDPYGLDGNAERKFVDFYIKHPTGNEEVDMATLNDLFELTRKYTADQFAGYTVPRSPDKHRTFAAALPPKGGIVTGNEGQAYVSLVAGEDVDIAGVYFVTDWDADGKEGVKAWAQGKYVLKANDRQSYPVPGAATHVCVVHKSDVDFTLGVEVDAKWK